MKVARWGNSLAVRLPNSVVEELGLKEGDEVEFRPEGEKNAFTVVPMPSREEVLDRMIERLRAYRGSLPADFKFDREEANER